MKKYFMALLVMTTIIVSLCACNSNMEKDAAESVLTNKNESKNEFSVVDTEYYTLNIPLSWENDCFYEVTEGENYNYTLRFYNKASLEKGYGGDLFSIRLLTEFEDYSCYPDYDILGSLEVYRIGSYNIVVTYPTDVQFSDETAEKYREMSSFIPYILNTISFKDECTFSKTPIETETQSSSNGQGDLEYGLYSTAPVLAESWHIIPNSFEVYGRVSLDETAYGRYEGNTLTPKDPYRLSLTIKATENNWYFIQKIYMDTLVFDKDGEVIKSYHTEYIWHEMTENLNRIATLGFDNTIPPKREGYQITENWSDFPENAYSAAVLLSFDVFSNIEFGIHTPDNNITVPPYEIRYVEPQVFDAFVNIADGKIFEHK